MFKFLLSWTVFHCGLLMMMMIFSKNIIPFKKRFLFLYCNLHVKCGLILGCAHAASIEFRQFWQFKFAYGALILSWGQFWLLPKLLQNLVCDIKIVLNDPKINIMLH
jgi:hypothetical protein